MTRRKESHPTLADIRDAAGLIAGVVLRTPFLPAPRLSALTGASVFVKYENLQATSSFKERGALVKLLSLSPDERLHGVVAMSAGNHAQAVAYNAQRLGIPATIVQGRYDIVCPIESADELVRAWPGAAYQIIPDAGHSAMEPGIRAAMVSATNRYRSLG